MGVDGVNLVDGRKVGEGEGLEKVRVVVVGLGEEVMGVEGIEGGVVDRID